MQIGLYLSVIIFYPINNSVITTWVMLLHYSTQRAVQSCRAYYPGCDLVLGHQVISAGKVCRPTNQTWGNVGQRRGAKMQLNQMEWNQIKSAPLVTPNCRPLGRAAPRLQRKLFSWRKVGAEKKNRTSQISTTQDLNTTLHSPQTHSNTRTQTHTLTHTSVKTTRYYATKKEQG